jgi:hypothetical protein
MAMPYTIAVQGTGAKASRRRVSGYLAGLGMPNVSGEAVEVAIEP